MSGIFISVLNMSLIASYTALVVMVARLLLQRAPKVFSYVLWAVVLFRLLCLFSFESSISMIPGKAATIPRDIIYSQNTSITTGTGMVKNTLNQTIQSTLPPVNPSTSVNDIGIVMEIGAIIWMVGIIGILSYGVISYFRLKHRLSTATLVKENIFESDRLQTPFVLGIIKPRIYIPIELSVSELDYIVKHEQTHIRRFDYIIKPVAFLALTMHWFNPLIWLSYFLMVKDMEMSCDESVIKHSNEDIRGKYSSSLLSLSAKQSRLLSPLAFGESNVKSRIKNVLNYKKHRFWVIAIAIVAVCAMVIGLASNPKEAFNEGKTIAEAPIEKSGSNSLPGSSVSSIDTIVKENLSIIMSSPKESSNPQDYINKHQTEYNTIIDLGAVALPNLFSEFEKGGETGLKGEIMERLCRTILGDEDIKYESTSPQDWYNTFKEYMQELTIKSNLEFVQKKYPKAAFIMNQYNQYYNFDRVKFSHSMVEIGGENLAYKNVNLDSLYETLTPAQVEQMMYRAVIYYKSVYQKDFTVFYRFSSDKLKGEIDKWGKNEKTIHGIDVMMSLNNYTDVAFPIGIEAPVQYDKKYIVNLTLDKNMSASITFEVYREGTLQVTDFAILLE